MPGRLTAQINVQQFTFDRKLVRQIRVDGRAGNDRIYAGFTAGNVVGRALLMTNRGGRDYLSIAGNGASMSGIFTAINKRGSVFSQKTASWTAIDGYDPVVWSAKRAAKGIVTSSAQVLTSAADTTDSSLKVGSLTVATAQSPFRGSPAGVGQMIQVEDYDNGGEGVAYHDTSSANFGKAYRPKDAVDIAAVSDTGGGYYVGWTRPGEWLEYTIDVPTNDLYSLSLRVACKGSGAKAHVEVDGVTAGGSIAIPNTLGWQTWKTVVVPDLPLTAGTHVLRLSMDAKVIGGYVGNFNWFSLASPNPMPPAAPSNLTGSVVSFQQINLAWTDNANNETGYSIDRKQGADGAWAPIAALAADSTGYSDQGLLADTEYSYRVEAQNGAGGSAYATSATVQTPGVVVPTPPSAPSGLVASAISSQQINLSWTDNADNESGFFVERKQGSGGTWQQIVQLAANTPVFSNSGLLVDTEYYYRVQAENTVGRSGYSSEASARTNSVLV
ncbi:MAG: fibronectin type III domain-containing protein, partial [Planctomycetota bacterium]|nr:fibronectin type III domain-containing protein [Planctomycetota bacterium]